MLNGLHTKYRNVKVHYHSVQLSYYMHRCEKAVELLGILSKWTILESVFKEFQTVADSRQEHVDPNDVYAVFGALGGNLEELDELLDFLLWDSSTMLMEDNVLPSLVKKVVWSRSGRGASGSTGTPISTPPPRYASASRCTGTRWPRPARPRPDRPWSARC